MDKYRKIKRACEINDSIFKEVLTNFNFKTEKDVKTYILKRFKDFKVKKAFPPIVANNCSEIHPKPMGKKLERGFLILDFGCKYGGYCSDMTRIIFLGKAIKKEKEIYNILLNCQKKCIKNLKVGSYCSELDFYARSLLKDYKRYFLHSLGHGLGVKIHENPRISSTSQDKIKKMDFITIEPGIYIKNIGIRIEDTIYVGDKIEILTKSNKNLIEVKLND